MNKEIILENYKTNKSKNKFLMRNILGKMMIKKNESFVSKYVG